MNVHLPSAHTFSSISYSLELNLLLGTLPGDRAGAEVSRLNSSSVSRERDGRARKVIAAGVLHERPPAASGRLMQRLLFLKVKPHLKCRGQLVHWKFAAREGLRTFEDAVELDKIPE